MATHETIGAYKLQGNESFSEYMIRLQEYFHRHHIREEKKQTAVFLTVVGSQTHNLLKSLLSPTPVHTKDVKYLSNVLNNYLEYLENTPTHTLTQNSTQGPKDTAPRSASTHTMSERMKFYDSRQVEHETVKQYYTKLTWIVNKCNFGQFREEALRDRFVYGLRSSSTKTHLLDIPDVTLRNALEISLQLEEEEDSRELERVGEGGGTWEKGSPFGERRGKVKKFIKRPIRGESKVGLDEEEVDDNAVLLVHKVDSQHESYRVTIKFPTRPVQFDVDTGTGLTVISKNTYKNIFGKKFHWKDNC